MDVAQDHAADDRTLDAQIELQVLFAREMNGRAADDCLQQRPMKKDQQEHETAKRNPGVFQPGASARDIGRAGFIHRGR
jgi:hypothetical protein